MPVVKVKENKTLPKHIDILIDTSGSMDTNDRLERTKTLIHIIVGNLGDQDTFSVTSFSHSRTQIVNTTQKSNKNWSSEVACLLPVGGTNIPGAFLDLPKLKIEKIDTRQRIILLISDGEDDSRAVSPYVRIMKNLQPQFHENLPTIVPIGIGDSFDGNLLSKLAERTHSKLIEIRDEDDSLQLEDKIKEAEAFFKVRSEPVSFKIDSLNKTETLGNCPYDQDVSRVLTCPTQIKKINIAFHINNSEKRKEKISPLNKLILSLLRLG